MRMSGWVRSYLCTCRVESSTVSFLLSTVLLKILGNNGTNRVRLNLFRRFYEKVAAALFCCNIRLFIGSSCDCAASNLCAMKFGIVCSIHSILCSESRKLTEKCGKLCGSARIETKKEIRPRKL